MKNKFMIFIVFVFITWQSYSQSLNYGFGFGLNNSNLIVSNFPDNNLNYKLGLQLNLMLKYNFNEKFGVSIEPGFANRGAIHRQSGYSDININLNYMILPIAVNYTLFSNFSVFIGPECSYRISDGKKNNINSIYNSKIDFGIIAGLSYKILNKFDIRFRYNRGFISTIKDIRFRDKHGNDKGEANVFNQGFTLSVAYMFR